MLNELFTKGFPLQGSKKQEAKIGKYILDTVDSPYVAAGYSDPQFGANAGMVHIGQQFEKQMMYTNRAQYAEQLLRETHPSLNRAVVKQSGIAAAKYVNNYNVDDYINNYFQQTIRPSQMLLDSESDALGQLREGLGLGKRAGLVTLPLQSTGVANQIQEMDDVQMMDGLAPNNLNGAAHAVAGGRGDGGGGGGVGGGGGGGPPVAPLRVSDGGGGRVGSMPPPGASRSTGSSSGPLESLQQVSMRGNKVLDQSREQLTQNFQAYHAQKAFDQQQASMIGLQQPGGLSNTQGLAQDQRIQQTDMGRQRKTQNVSFEPSVKFGSDSGSLQIMSFSPGSQVGSGQMSMNNQEQPMMQRSQHDILSSWQVAQAQQRVANSNEGMVPQTRQEAMNIINNTNFEDSMYQVHNNNNSNNKEGSKGTFEDISMIDTSTKGKKKVIKKGKRYQQQEEEEKKEIVQQQRERLQLDYLEEGDENVPMRQPTMIDKEIKERQKEYEYGWRVGVFPDGQPFQPSQAYDPERAAAFSDQKGVPFITIYYHEVKKAGKKKFSDIPGNMAMMGDFQKFAWDGLSVADILLNHEKMKKSEQSDTAESLLKLNLKPLPDWSETTYVPPRRDVFHEDDIRLMDFEEPHFSAIAQPGQQGDPWRNEITGQPLGQLESQLFTLFFLAENKQIDVQDAVDALEEGFKSGIESQIEKLYNAFIKTEPGKYYADHIPDFKANFMKGIPYLKTQLAQAIQTAQQQYIEASAIPQGYLRHLRKTVYAVWESPRLKQMMEQTKQQEEQYEKLFKSKGYIEKENARRAAIKAPLLAAYVSEPNSEEPKKASKAKKKPTSRSRSKSKKSQEEEKKEEPADATVTENENTFEQMNASIRSEKSSAGDILKAIMGSIPRKLRSGFKQLVEKEAKKKEEPKKKEPKKNKPEPTLPRQSPRKKK